MKPISKALFAAKLESLSFCSLEHILPLAAAGLKEIVFLSVMDRDEVGFVPFGGFDKELAKELQEKAHLTFADWGSELQKRGVAWKEVIEVGNPEPKIIEVAAREGVDLIVTGKHTTISDAIYPHGVEFGILRDSSLPVLVFAHKREAEESTEETELLRHVLVATDFSGRSDAALGLVLGFGGLVGSISLLHVLETDRIERMTPAQIDEAEKGAKEKLDEIASKARARGLAVDTHLLTGDVSDVIVGFSADRGCTSIALGSRRTGGIDEVLHGSVSHRVVVDASVPVFAVPSAD